MPPIFFSLGSSRGGARLRSGTGFTEGGGGPSLGGFSLGGKFAPSGIPGGCSLGGNGRGARIIGDVGSIIGFCGGGPGLTPGGSFDGVSIFVFFSAGYWVGGGAGE